MDIIYFAILMCVVWTDAVHSTTSQCKPCTCHRTHDTLKVDCSSRNLKEAPSGLPTSLTIFNLTNNNISSIPKTYFEKFPRIQKLYLSYNPSLGLNNASESFYGLRNSNISLIDLTQVVESYPGYVTMEKNFFQHLTNTPLNKIYLDRNWILTVGENALESAPKTLQVLSMRRSRLILSKVFIFQFRFLPNLTTFDISKLNKEDRLHLNREFKGDHVSEFVKRRIRSTRRGIVSQDTDNGIGLPPKLEEVILEECYLQASINGVRFLNNSLKRIRARNNVVHRLLGPIIGMTTVEEIDLTNSYCREFAPNLSSYLPRLKKLFLKGNFFNFDGIENIFLNFKELTHLDLSLNRINKLPLEAFNSLVSLEKLYLKGNFIYQFEANIDKMHKLNSLDLSNNEISFLTQNTIKQLEEINHKTNLTLDLSGNPFICSCDTLYFIKWIMLTDIMIANKENVSCFVYEDDKSESKDLLKMKQELDEKCASFGIAMGILVLVTGSIIIAVMGIVHRFRWKLRYLYYVARGIYRGSLVTQHSENVHFHYDAFISYAEEDADFINTVVGKLEAEGHLRLCLHQRDFRPGESISGNILSAIQRSRHVVIVLSPNFLDSYWCRWEFEMARMEGLYTERNVVILVRYQEVLPSLVPRDMLYMMHTQTYLEYPDGQQDQDTFWTALKQAVEDN